MKNFVMGMAAAALVSACLAYAAVPTSATVKATCMSDGTMRIETDARPGSL